MQQPDLGAHDSLLYTLQRDGRWEAAQQHVQSMRHEGVEAPRSGNGSARARGELLDHVWPGLLAGSGSRSDRFVSIAGRLYRSSSRDLNTS